MFVWHLKTKLLFHRVFSKQTQYEADWKLEKLQVNSSCTVYYAPKLSFQVLILAHEKVLQKLCVVDSDPGLLARPDPDLSFLTDKKSCSINFANFFFNMVQSVRV